MIVCSISFSVMMLQWQISIFGSDWLHGAAGAAWLVEKWMRLLEDLVR